MDQLIRIKTPQENRTGMGFSKPSFSSGVPMRAHYEPVLDSERWQAGRTNVIAMARFTVRVRRTGAQIGHRDLVLFQGQDWKIIGLKRRGRNLGLEITAVQEVAGDVGGV